MTASSYFNGNFRKPKYEKEDRRIVVEDIARGKELQPIPVVNNYGYAAPKDFVYTTVNTLSSGTRKFVDKSDAVLQGCSCFGECGAYCECENSSIIGFDPEHRLVQNPFGYNFYNDFYVECGAHCGCRGSCKRQILPHDRVLKKLEIQWMKGKQFGVVAAQPIAAGMPIAEYVGEVFVERKEYDLYPKSDYQQDLLTDNKYNKFIIDARRIGNIARFINHSCFNNVLQICVYPSIPDFQRTFPLPRVALIAFRDILLGQELCFDYRAAYFNSRHISCLCYEPNCHAPPYDHPIKARSVKNQEHEIERNKRKMHKLFYVAGDLEVEEMD